MDITDLAYWIERQLYALAPSLPHLPAGMAAVLIGVLGIFFLGFIAVVCEALSGLWGFTSRYAIRQSLMTPPERAFLHALDRAADGIGRVMGKPRVADVLTVAGGSAQGRHKRLRRMFGMHFDYVICDAKSLAPLVAVELDDKSHNRRDRRKRDAYLAAVCRRAGLPLMRVPVSNRYDTQKLEQRLRAIISSG